MNSMDQTATDRQSTRHNLLMQYLRLQRDLMDSDPGSSAYQGTVHAFRQLGYALISAGLEEDLDRLLRIRVLNGGRETRASRSERTVPVDLHIIERRRSG